VLPKQFKMPWLQRNYALLVFSFGALLNMAADAIQVQDGKDKSPPSNQTADHDHLFDSSGFMDGLKHGWHKVQAGAAVVAHQGMEEGRKLANSHTGKQIQEKAVEAGHQGMEEGRRLANSRTTQERSFRTRARYQNRQHK
jgi:hypothetical protein